MLGVNTYSVKYIEDCREKIESELTAYRKMVKALISLPEKNGKAAISAVENFEPVFFNNMVLILDALFVHRVRALEGKDGNALNEVRLLCNSIMLNQGVMTVDNTIKYDPVKSVLKYNSGDQIRISEDEFVPLFKAFFADLKKKYAENVKVS